MNRSYYAILISQTATNLSFALYAMVVVLHLYHESGSTGLSAAVTLVTLLFKMLSGVVLPAVSDRFRPLPLLLFSQLSQLILLAVLTFVISQSTFVISQSYGTWNLIATLPSTRPSCSSVGHSAA